MLTTPFGNTGLHLSPLTVGGMRFLHGWDAPHDYLPEESLQNVHNILQRALSVGINLIETARGYGKSERLIGQVIHRLPFDRQGWHIMTKARPTSNPQELWQILQDSLQRLAVGTIDLFALHGINTLDDLHVSLHHCLPVLRRAQARGLLGSIGFSTHAPLSVILLAIDSGAFDFLNIHYNYFNPRNREAVERAAQRGMGVMIISPNEKAGFLYQPSPELRNLTAPLDPVVFNERWLLQQEAIGTLSIGLSEPAHLSIHLEAIAKGWGGVEAGVLHRLEQAARADVRYPCATCKACLPCPAQIDIPEVLRLAHGAQVLGIADFAKSRYDQFQPEDPWVRGAKAAACNNCDECLPRCPHGLAIPKLLKEAQACLFPGAR